MALTAAERMRATRARRRATREAEARAAGVVEGQRQVALLPLADLVERHVEAPSSAARGRHRAYLQVLETRFPAPLGRMAAIFAQEPEDLARKLACTKLEAQRIIFDAAKASLPYWHQAQPTAVQMSGMPLAPVQIVVSEATARALDESEEDQRVIEGEAA